MTSSPTPSSPNPRASSPSKATAPSGGRASSPPPASADGGGGGGGGGKGGGKGSNRLPLIAGVAAVAAAVFLFGRGGADDFGEAGPNWQYHEGLKRGELTQVDRTGSQTVTEVSLGVADEATALQGQVVAALEAGDVAGAEQAIAQLQPTPAGAPAPKIDEKLARDLKSGEVKLYNVKLWDSCAEDGDVVEILVNGEYFSQVGLFHAPTDVVIPVPVGGSPQVTLRGVHDGGGGITIGCETSQGQYFSAVFAPGQSMVLRFGI